MVFWSSCHKRGSRKRHGQRGPPNYYAVELVMGVPNKATWPNRRPPRWPSTTKSLLSFLLEEGKRGSGGREGAVQWRAREGHDGIGHVADLREQLHMQLLRPGLTLWLCWFGGSRWLLLPLIDSAVRRYGDEGTIGQVVGRISSEVRVVGEQREERRGVEEFPDQAGRRPFRCPPCSRFLHLQQHRKRHLGFCLLPLFVSFSIQELWFLFEGFFW